MSKSTPLKVPSVLAFEKKLIPSDAYMFGTTWENRFETKSHEPLNLKEKSVRGTISNRLKGAKKDPAKLNAEVEKANLQTVDSCALKLEHDTLKVNFTLKVLSGVQKPSVCNNPEYQQSLSTAVNEYIEKEGCEEQGMRYATNIASGRFLWRNRVGAEKIEVQVKKIKEGHDNEWTFDGASISLREFNSDSDSINKLGKEIAATLSGKEDYLLLEINAFVKMGNGQDVYPSEELILDKGNSKSKKSKVLYQINNIAGMHSQKIGNALRTIDTWYPNFNETDTGPIAIEPYGSVTSLGKAFRNPKEKADFYTLFDKFSCGVALENKDDEHYVIATLIRGGVFGNGGKD